MPLMVSGFIQSIVLLTDSAFLSRYSTLAFDAVGNAGLLFITCFMILVGLGDGTQIILARRIGEKKRSNFHMFSPQRCWSNLCLPQRSLPYYFSSLQHG